MEIGCFEDETFNKINIDKKVGVDPISGGNVRLTSDNFFKINKDRFDIIFIDGLHAFEQVKKDITNSLNILNKNGVLLFMIACHKKFEIKHLLGLMNIGTVMFGRPLLNLELKKSSILIPVMQI